MYPNRKTAEKFNSWHLDPTRYLQPGLRILRRQAILALGYTISFLQKGHIQAGCMRGMAGKKCSFDIYTKPLL